MVALGEDVFSSAPNASNWVLPLAWPCLVCGEAGMMHLVHRRKCTSVFQYKASEGCGGFAGEGASNVHAACTQAGTFSACWIWGICSCW